MKTFHCNILPLAAFAVLGLCALTPAANAQIVLDGGFESVNFSGAAYTYTGGGGFDSGTAKNDLGDGWQATQGIINVSNVVGAGGDVPHSGSYAAYLDNGASVNTISQTLTTTPGQSYTVSYYLADDARDPVSVTFGNQTLFSGFAPTNGTTLASQYVLYSYVVTANSASTVLSFTGQDVIGEGTYLDDVTVLVNTAAVPEPGSIALLVGMATIGVGVLRKRRK